MFVLTDHKYYLGEGNEGTSGIGADHGPRDRHGHDKATHSVEPGRIFSPNNIDDELQIQLSNRLGYRADDHGSTTATADPLTIVWRHRYFRYQYVADRALSSKAMTPMTSRSLSMASVELYTRHQTSHHLPIWMF